MSFGALMALFHVGGALLFVAGYVATNVLTELARRSTDEPTLRAALGFSGWFDRRLLIPFATLSALAGLALVVARGYAWTAPWIVASTLLYLAVMLVGIFVWGPGAAGSKPPSPPGGSKACGRSCASRASCSCRESRTRRSR